MNSGNHNKEDTFALFGNPVGQSLSPLMHRAAYEKMGVAGRYVSFCVENEREIVRTIREKDIRGASVTIPFKTSMIKHLDVVDISALTIGAVNTITNMDGKLSGSNTDWIGFITDLREAMTIRDRTFVVLGTGGAARAVLFGILQDGGIPLLCGRNRKKAAALAAAFNCGTLPPAAIENIQADVLINTTPVGMHPHVDVSPVDSRVLSSFSWVVDIVYNPLHTKLLRDAAEAGCSVRSGLGMFVHQGAEQIRHWTGMEPPRDVMKTVVRERLEGR